jgi:hypothetical protein
MEKKEVFAIAFALIFLTGLFFNKTILKGWAPFPGDSLIAEYKPFQTTSYLGYNPGAYPHKAQYPDTLRQLYPWRSLAIAQWSEGKAPLWNPYNFAGTPLLANFQAAALYPLNVLFAFFSRVDAWTILVIIQPLLAALFTYLYARKVGLTPWGAALASISYGFSGFMAVWLEYNTVGHIILWLPFLLLALEHIAQRPTVFWILAFAAGNTTALLAGHPQVYTYLLAFCALYALLRISQPRRRLFVAGIAALGVGMAAVQLVPGAELIKNAARSPHEFAQLFGKILIQPWQLLSLAFPNIFGNPATRSYWPADTFVGKVTTIGLVPLFFLPAALRVKHPLAKLFLWASVGVLLLMSANPVTYLLYKLPLPLISSSSPTLMGFLFAFSLSLVAGFGLDHWMKEKHTIAKLFKRAALVLVLLVGLAALTQVPLFTEFAVHSGVALRALVYAAILTAPILILWYVAIRYPKWRRFAMIALIVVHVADLFVFFQRFNPFVPKELVFPKHEIITELASFGTNRFWGYGTAAIPANFASEYGIYSPEGYDPLYPKWYGELLHGSYDGKLLSTFDNTTRSDAVIAPGFGEEGFGSPARKRMLDAAGVRYVLDLAENGSTAKTFPPGSFTSVYNQNSWRILENLDAAPKAFLTTDILTYDTREDFAAKFFAPEFDPTRQVLLPVMPALTYPLDRAGTAEVTSYSTNAITIKTTSGSPAVLVVTDTYYPGWKATIDGAEAPILRANWTFRAIPILAGTHTVDMAYQPSSFAIGRVVSIASFIVLCIIVLMRTLLL